MINPRELAGKFQRTFGKAPRIFSAPGRVNLIGEHTDYNDGFVLPVAIDRRTHVAAALNDSSAVRVQSLDLKQEAVFSLREPNMPLGKSWLGYVAGVAFELEKSGARLAGADLMIDSDVPIGAGLSSSAALEVSVGAALLALCDETLGAIGLSLAAQKAEHNYVGTRCGIMDQLTVASAREGHALLIDCRSLELKQIDLNLPDTTMVICNTKVKHELAASAYNQRRHECEQAVSVLRQSLPTIQALRDVDVSELEKHQADLPEVIYRRAHHVITENARTLDAAIALEAGGREALGRLMAGSHNSLRDDYEVSCAELDLMVDLAAKCEGVFGARMTGGGFGGCTVHLGCLKGGGSFRRVVNCAFGARNSD